MIYQFTGQPGHGKTLHAIELLLEFKAKGRAVYACNVREFDYDKTGVQKMTPEQFRDWMNFLPDGAVALVDECYEHGMLPKRGPSSKVPDHVERLATHRHRGIDFIFVCQSPDKQTDGFVHDLIERHIHVRRRFGTQYVHLREFDRYERNPEKAHPLVLRRGTLPKKIFGTYRSTELDTTERKIPWYIIALIVGLPAGLGFMYWTFSGIGERLAGEAAQESLTPEAASKRTEATEAPADGAEGRQALTLEAYIQRFIPRVPSQPWSAPAYDKLTVAREAPRLICASSKSGLNANGEHKPAGCSCITEQGTRYQLDLTLCVKVARDGQYEPFRTQTDYRRVDGYTQQQRLLDGIASRGAGGTPAAMASPADAGGAALVGGGGTSTPYGAPPRASGTFALDPSPANSGGGP